MYKSNHPSHRDNWLPNHYGIPGDCQDQFAVWAPGLRDKCFVNTAFNLFAMEVEEQREKEREARNFYGGTKLY